MHGRMRWILMLSVDVQARRVKYSLQTEWMIKAEQSERRRRNILTERKEG
jgi:hypothetical protein